MRKNGWKLWMQMSRSQASVDCLHCLRILCSSTPAPSSPNIMPDNEPGAGPTPAIVMADYVSSSFPEQQAAPNIPKTTSTGNDDAEAQPLDRRNSGPPTNPVPHADAWFKSWFTHFREISADATWQTLVSEWVRFEMLTPTDGVSVIASSFFLTPSTYSISDYPLPRVQRRSPGGLSAKNLSASLRPSRSQPNLAQHGNSGGQRCNRHGGRASHC